MTKYDESPVYWLNSFVESRLRGITVAGGPPDLDEEIIPQESEYVTSLATSTTDFALPFMSPGAQQSEIMNVYNKNSKRFNHIPLATYSVNSGRPLDTWSYNGKVTYILYSGDTNKLFEIGEFVRDLCGREDWSAYDANYFFRHDNTYPFDFKYICIDSIAGPFPAREEGGLYSSMVVIDYAATFEGPGRADDWGSNDYGLGMRI